MQKKKLWPLGLDFKDFTEITPIKPNTNYLIFIPKTKGQRWDSKKLT